MDRRTAFTAAGIVLVAGTVLGLAVDSFTEVDLSGAGDGSSALGTTGVVAVAIGWAAFARGGLRAAGRGAVAIGLACLALAGVLTVLVVFRAPIDLAYPAWVPNFEVYDNIEGDEAALEPSTVSFVVLIVIVVGALALVSAIPMAICGLFAWLASQRSTSTSVHAASMVGAMLPVLGELALSVRREAWSAVIAAAAACVWLLWAVNRARAADAEAVGSVDESTLVGG